MMLRDIEIFESYINLGDNLNKDMKYIMLGEEFELSNKRIEQIIYQMLKEIVINTNKK